MRTNEGEFQELSGRIDIQLIDLRVRARVKMEEGWRMESGG